MVKRILLMIIAVILLVTMSVSALAEEKKTVTITSDYGAEGKISYNIPGVIATSTMRVADKGQFDEDNWYGYQAVWGKELPVYTIRPGTRINTDGSAYRIVGFTSPLKIEVGSQYLPLKVKDGKLVKMPQSEHSKMLVDLDGDIEKAVETVYAGFFGADRVPIYIEKGHYIRFYREGYYLFNRRAISPIHINPNNPLMYYPQNIWKSAVVIHVKGDGSKKSYAPEISNNPYDVNKLRSAIDAMSKEFNEGKVSDTYINVINSQLSYLIRDIKTAKINFGYSQKDMIEESHRAIDAGVELMNKIHNSKNLSYYSKPGAEKKTDSGEINKTGNRLNEVRIGLSRTKNMIWAMWMP